MYTLFGHRGNEKEYIENTVEAITNCKYKGIEVDVRLTYDNNIILHHDESLMRIYNSPYLIKNLYLDDIKKHFNTVFELTDFICFCKLNNKKIIIDIKEKKYNEILYIIDYCINFLKKINYDIKNIIFLCWENIIKPFKNIIFLRAIDNDFIYSYDIDLFKNKLLFDGICLKYTGTKKNIYCINKIKSKNMLVNIYTNKNIQDIKLNIIKPDFITL